MTFKTPADLRAATRKVNYRPSKIKRLLRKFHWALFTYLPPQHDHTVLTRNGVLTFNSKDRTTGRILCVQRNHEFEDIVTLLTHMKELGVISDPEKDIVLDVGGYLGMSSILMLHEGFFSKAVAFEPNPDNFRLLQKNVRDNFLQDRIICHNVALSDTNGILGLELSVKNYGDHRVRRYGEIKAGHYGEEYRRTVEIHSRRLDDMINEGIGVDPLEVRLIWMDIQGHEGRFIAGARKFLESHPNIPIIMEFWPYAILRSGITKAEFVDTVSRLYTHFHDYTGTAVTERHPINELGEFFDSRLNPAGGGTLIFMNDSS